MWRQSGLRAAEGPVLCHLLAFSQGIPAKVAIRIPAMLFPLKTTKDYEFLRRLLYQRYKLSSCLCMHYVIYIFPHFSIFTFSRPYLPLPGGQNPL